MRAERNLCPWIFLEENEHPLLHHKRDDRAVLNTAAARGQGQGVGPRRSGSGRRSSLRTSATAGGQTDANCQRGELVPSAVPACARREQEHGGKKLAKCPPAMVGIGRCRCGGGGNCKRDVLAGSYAGEAESGRRGSAGCSRRKAAAAECARPGEARGVGKHQRIS